VSAQHAQTRTAPLRTLQRLRTTCDALHHAPEAVRDAPEGVVAQAWVRQLAAERQAAAVQRQRLERGGGGRGHPASPLLSPSTS
jgi:hypothetical protein